MLNEQEKPYDILQRWDLDSELPTEEEMQIVANQRDFLKAMVDKYTRAIEEWEADERIRRYQSKPSQESNDIVPDGSDG